MVRAHSRASAVLVPVQLDRSRQLAATIEETGELQASSGSTGSR